MKRFQLFLIGVSAIWAAGGSLAACGGDDQLTDAGDSGGGDVKVKPDVQAGDAGDGGPIVVHPAGTELAPSDGIQIFGVTADDDVIYADGSQANALFAVPSGGGTAVKIGTPTGFAVGLHNKTVFVWTGLTAKGVGALSIWEHGGVLTPITGGTKSAPNGGFAASPDGKHILFTANADTNGAVGDFMGANSDGTNQVSLVTGVDVGSGNACTPVSGFLNDGEAVTSTCTVTPGDGGTPSATVTAYAIGTTTWAPTLIMANALDVWSTDTAGDKLLVATPTAISFCTLAGVCVPADAKNIQNGFATFMRMTKNGATALYSTAAGDLHTVTPPGLPAVVQAANVNFVRSVSADEKYILFTKTFDNQQFGGDLYLTSTAAGAPAPVTLVGTQTGALFGVNSLDDFTADSAYVVWIQNLNTSLGLGDLYALPVAGGTPKQFATGEWQNVTATGTKIVFNDNCADCSGTAGTGNAHGDIKVVDVATANAPTLLQAGADIPLVAGGNSLFLDKAKTHVIYTYSQNDQASGVPASGGNGLYSVAIP